MFLIGSGLFALTCMGCDVIRPNFMKISTCGDRLKLSARSSRVGWGQRVGAEGQMAYGKEQRCQASSYGVSGAAQEAFRAASFMRLSAQPLRTTYSLTGLHLSSVVARAHRSRRAIVALQRLRPVRVAPGLEADDAVSQRLRASSRTRCKHGHARVTAAGAR